MRTNQEIVGQNTRYLIVKISWETDQVALSDLTSIPPKKPICLAIDQVSINIKSKKWQIVENSLPEYLYKPDEEIKPEWLEKRDTALGHLSPLIDDDYEMNRYLFEDPSGILSNLINKSGKSKKYIHSQLTRWFSNGGIDNAVLPTYHNCGQNYSIPEIPVFNEDNTPDLSSKPGPKTKYGNPYRQVTEVDRKNIKQFCKSINDSTVSLEDQYTSFVDKHMSLYISPDIGNSDENIHENKIRFPRKLLISPKSFKREVNKFIPKLAWIKKSLGQIGYDKDKKGKPGVAREGLRGPGQRYEIDATVADVYIKYEFSEEELLSCGRPIIFMVIDTWSSMIVGFHVAYDGPNWSGASQALYNAFENKVEFCRRWGVEISEEDWPCHYISQEVVWDRGGENTDRNLASILKGKIGITLMKLNAYHRGDAKGTVEKAFDTLQKTLLKFIPGKVIKVPKKEDQDASRKPFLSHEDFMKRIIKIILHKNNFSIKSNAHNEHYEKMNIGYTRRDIWTAGMEDKIFSPKIDKQRIRFSLLPEEKAMVTDKGIRFRGLFYSNKEIEKKLWLDKAKNLGHYNITIRYTNLSTNHIWYQCEEDNKILKMDLLTRSEAYQNQIWANVLHRLELKKNELALADEARFSNSVELEHDLAEMDRETAKKNKKHTKSESKSRQPGVKERKDVASAMNAHLQVQQVEADMNTSSEQTANSQPKASKSPENQDLSDPRKIPDDE